MNIQNVAVIGAGLMGNGIAQCCAQAGYRVVNIDVSKAQLEKAQTSIDKLFTGKVAKGRITAQEKAEILGRITYSTEFEAAADADVLLEAAPEKIELKKELFQKAGSFCREETLILSNTSGLCISEMAAVTKRPDRFMGMHFFYPAPIMKLAELVRGVFTSDETFEDTVAFAVSLGKETAVANETPGFLVNRILVPMMNEAMYCVMEGAKPEDVDRAMKLGANWPMGPLELADFTGLDITLSTMTGLYDGFSDSKYRPCPLLKNMVRAGLYGRKSGRGFYTY